MPPPRILILSEIPTPYRLPLYERLAGRLDLDVEIVFCAATEPDRPWQLDEQLARVPHRVLPGIAPRIRTRTNTFVYEINPSIVRILARGRWDALVIGGYAVFAEQAAIAWARLRRVPYLIHDESHLSKPRAAWLRAAKRFVLPHIVGGAAAGLAVGSAAARYLAAYGIPPERIRIVPNTIDVAGFGTRAEAARAHGERLRRERGLPNGYVLFAGRLVEAKGVPELIQARRLLGERAPALVVAGEGPLAAELAAEPGVHMLGFQDESRLIELYALADATVVPSRVEPWGVVVNEALACGSPVIASDAVGAVEDLLVDGENGRVFPAGVVSALAEALAAPPPSGDPSRGRIESWTYEYAEDQFLQALRLVLPGRLPT